MHIFRFLRSRPFIVLTLLYCLALVVLDQKGFFAAPPDGDVGRLISPAPFDITGTVLRSRMTKNNKELLFIKVTSVDGHPWGGKLLVNSSVQGGADAGDIVYLRGVLTRPRPARKPGAFDYAVYLRRMNIYAVTYVSSVEVTGSACLPFYHRLAKAVRSNMINTLQRSLSPDNASVIIPMLIGGKQGLSEEDMRAFTDAGVMHILVVSGLNVGYVVLIVLGFFRLVGFKRRHAALLTIPFIFLFMLIAGDNPPVVRATVMAVSVILSLSLSREPLIYQSLALAAAAILLFEPQALFTASFQLSFAATLGIVSLYPLFMQLFRRLPWWLQKTAGATISVSLAAQLAVLPLIAYYFNKVSLIGLVSNIVIVPLAGLITAAGIVLYLAHFVADALAMPAGFVTSFLVRTMRYLVYLFAGFPLSTVHVGAPSFAAITGYYALLIAVVTVKKIPGLRRGPGRSTERSS